MDVVHFDIAKNADPQADITIDKTTEVSFNKPGQFNLNGGIIPRQVKQLGDPMTVALKNDDSVRDYNVEPSYDSSTGQYTLTENVILHNAGGPAEGTWYLSPKGLGTGPDSYYMEDTVQPWNSLTGFVNNVNDSLYRSATGFHYLNSNAQYIINVNGPVKYDNPAHTFVSDTWGATIDNDVFTNPKKDTTGQQQYLIYNRHTNFNPSGAFDEYLIRNTANTAQTFNLLLVGSFIENEKYSLEYGKDKITERPYHEDIQYALNCTDATRTSQLLGTFTLQPGQVKRVSPVMHYKKDGTPLQNIIVLPVMKQSNNSDYVRLMLCNNTHIEVVRVCFGYKVDDFKYRGVNWSDMYIFEDDLGSGLVDQSEHFNFQYNYTFPSIRMEGGKVTYLQDGRDAFSLKLNDTSIYRFNLSDTEEINVQRAQGVEGSKFKQQVKVYNQSFGAQFTVTEVSGSPNTYSVNATGLSEGNGYHQGQEIVIDGTLLDGSTGANDLTLTLPAPTLTLSASGTPDSDFSSTTINYTNSDSFTVTNTQGVYTLSSISGFTTGYRDGQIIVIPGNSLAGQTPFNDLTVTILNTFTLAASDIAGTSNLGAASKTINDIGHLRVHLNDTNYAHCIVENFTQGTTVSGSTAAAITHTLKGSELGGTDSTNDLTLTSHNELLSGTGLVSGGSEQVVQTTAKRDLESSVMIRRGEADAIYNDLQYIMATVGNDFTGEQSATNSTTQRGNYVVYIPVDKDDDQNYHDVMSNVGPLQIDNNNNRVKVDFKGVCYNPTTGEVEYVPLKNSNKRKRMIHINAEMKLQ